MKRCVIAMAVVLLSAWATADGRQTGDQSLGEIRGRYETLRAQFKHVDSQLADLAKKQRELEATRDALKHDMAATQAQWSAAQRTTGVVSNPAPSPAPAMTTDQKLDAILSRLDAMEKRIAEIEKKR